METQQAMHYIRILDGGGDVWGVRIPDVPGCHGGGATPEAAVADASSALREIAADAAACGEELVRARTLTELVAAGEGPRTGEAAVMIPLLLERGRLVKANISMDAGTLAAIDAAAARRGLTRSSFMVTAALEKITASGG
jgi:predicted RNase H-like HicB family nuclease